jgi:hypothetical protein
MAQGAPASQPVEMQELEVGPFLLRTPVGWTARAVVRGATAYEVTIPPGEAGGEPLTLQLDYFGKRTAPKTDDKIAEWFGQFRQPDGRASREAGRREEEQIEFGTLTLVEITGTFVDARPEGRPVERPGYMLLAAVAPSDRKGPYFFQLYGPEAQVRPLRETFREVMRTQRTRIYVAHDGRPAALPAPASQPAAASQPTTAPSR